MLKQPPSCHPIDHALEYGSPCHIDSLPPARNMTDATWPPVSDDHLAPVHPGIHDSENLRPFHRDMCLPAPVASDMNIPWRHERPNPKRTVETFKRRFIPLAP